MPNSHRPAIARPQDRLGDEQLRILIVDDEPHILNLLRMGLSYEGFAVAEAQDGPSALTQAAEFKPHLVVLDLMLPGIDGIEVAARLRRDPELFIIMLTARDTVDDRLVGFDVGADDYLVKPFSFEELLVRIRAVMRRRLPAQEEVLRVGPITLDQGRHMVTMEGEIVELTPREYDLLRLFLLNPHRVLPRQLILDRVWGYDFYGNENNVEAYIAYLRRKLGDREHRLIETVRGVGYRLSI